MAEPNYKDDLVFPDFDEDFVSTLERNAMQAMYYKELLYDCKVVLSALTDVESIYGVDVELLKKRLKEALDK